MILKYICEDQKILLDGSHGEDPPEESREIIKDKTDIYKWGETDLDYKCRITLIWFFIELWLKWEKERKGKEVEKTKIVEYFFLVYFFSLLYFYWTAFLESFVSSMHNR